MKLNDNLPIWASGIFLIALIGATIAVIAFVYSL